MTPTNALILNLPGGRLTLGPLDIGTGTVPLRIDTATTAFQMAREVHLTREDARQVDRAIGLWLHPDLPPSDIEAEQKVLGTVLRFPFVFTTISVELGERHFADPVHGLIWETIGNIRAESDVADAEAVWKVLKEEPRMMEVGGAPYLAQLVSAAVYVLDAAILARRLVDLHRQREADRSIPL